MGFILLLVCREMLHLTFRFFVAINFPIDLIIFLLWNFFYSCKKDTAIIHIANKVTIIIITDSTADIMVSSMDKRSIRTLSDFFLCIIFVVIPIVK